MARGYPDFYGQPIFEKLGPLEKITNIFYPAHANEYKKMLDISNRGILQKLTLFIGCDVGQCAFNIAINIEGLPLYTVDFLMPSELNGGLFPDDMFISSSYNRLLNEGQLKLERELNFNDSIDITITNLYELPVTYVLFGYYRKIL